MPARATGAAMGADSAPTASQRGPVVSGEMTDWQLQDCPICHDGGTTLVYEVPDRLLDDPEPLRFTLRRCERCDLLIQSPRPRHLERFYVGYPNHAPFRRPKWVAVLLRLWDLPRELKLRSLLADRARILEIGCGSGSNSDVLTRHAGWSYRGLEPSPRAVEVARERGLDVIQGDASTLAEAEGRYDLLFMQHVFEHLPDPVEVLERAASKLTESGLVMLVVPNHRSLEHWAFRRFWIGLEQPRHLWVFSPRSIERLLDVAGFTVQSISHSARPSGFIASFEFLVRNWRSRYRIPRWARRLFLVALAPVGIFAAAIRLGGALVVVATPKRSRP